MLRLLSFFILCLFLTSCSHHSLERRLDLADSLVKNSNLVKNDIQTSFFLLRTYEKIANNKDRLRVYIEGDGLAWINKYKISNDPTPINPITLRLASKDKQKNVLYMARPCQYTLKKDKKCNSSYWSKKRFSEEVINSFDEALDILKTKHHFKKIELVGFSGGGAIATLLAARRSDVIKIITIAGNLNHNLVNKIHEVSQMKESLNPIDIASKISHIPQVHYVGEDDKVVPMDIAKSFFHASKNIDNIKIILLKNTTHSKGWDKLTLE